MRKEIFLIDNYRLANCHNLMAALNLWNNAAIGGASLEDKKLLDLVKQIKARTNSIISICQNHPGYVPWTTIKKGRKRPSLEDEGATRCQKRIKSHH